MIRFSVLGSGSSGNLSYVETANTRILVDAGFSCKEIERRLALLKVEPSGIDAVVVTHEHTDHVRGLGVFARRYKVPVLINEATLSNCSKNIGDIPIPVLFSTGDTLTFRDLEVHFISKCHDAVDPVALTFSSNGYKLGIVTDLGRPTSLILESIRHCNALILEFNHDLELLERSSYPLELKRRIRGPEGHLSNRQAARLLEQVTHGRLEFVVLAHLSQVNNSEKLAYSEAATVLQNSVGNRTSIIVSSQYSPMPVASIGEGGKGVY